MTRNIAKPFSRVKQREYFILPSRLPKVGLSYSEQDMDGLVVERVLQRKSSAVEF